MTEKAAGTGKSLRPGRTPMPDELFEISWKATMSGFAVEKYLQLTNEEDAKRIAQLLANEYGTEARVVKVVGSFAPDETT